MAETVIKGSALSGASPSRLSNGATRAARMSAFGELVGERGKADLVGLCDDGAYYVATNPTPGTGVAGIAAADGFDDTEALLYLRNNATASEGTRIYLDYILLSATAAGTNGTNFSYAMTLDTGAARYASGGSAITPVSPNMQNSDSPSCTLYFGAVVPSTSSTDRLVSHKPLRSVIKVVGDKYLFDFGGSKDTSDMATAGTAICNMRIPCPPVVLGPTDMFLLHEFAASQSVAATYEFEIGFWVR